MANKTDATTSATGKSSPKAKDAPAPFRGYIRCELQKTDKETYVAWRDLCGDDGALSHIVKLTDSGYRFSVGPKNGDFVASITNLEGDPATQGYVLTAFAGDSVSAVYALLFKHLVKLAGDWGTGENDDDWHVR